MQIMSEEMFFKNKSGTNLSADILRISVRTSFKLVHQRYIGARTQIINLSWDQNTSEAHLMRCLGIHFCLDIFHLVSNINLPKSKSEFYPTPMDVSRQRFLVLGLGSAVALSYSWKIMFRVCVSDGQPSCNPMKLICDTRAFCFLHTSSREYNC